MSAKPTTTLGCMRGILATLRISPRPDSLHNPRNSTTCRAEAPFRRSRSPPGPRREGRRPPPPPRYDPEPPPREGPTDAEVWLYRLQRLPPTSRSVALQQLLRIEEEGAFAGLVGGSPQAPPPAAVPTDDIDDAETEDQGPTTAGGRAALDGRSRRQATDMVSSVTRWRKRLEWILTNLPKPTNLDRMDPPLRLLLLLGAYEILELNLPGHAINEHVSLAKAVMHEGCGSVTNGVLRTLVRCREAGTVPSVPPPSADESPATVAAKMATWQSHPPWLVKKWLEAYGSRATLALLRHNNRRPAYSLRLAPGSDPAALAAELTAAPLEDDISVTGVAARPSKYLPNDFLVVESGLQAVLSSGVLTRGAAQVQDEAAGLVVAMLDPQPGESVLDCCAAPGGKTLFAAARMKRTGRLVALDSSAARLKAVAATAKAQGVPLASPGTGGGPSADAFLSLVAQDARQYCINAVGSGDAFDRVLVDAPCSGTGVLAKRADLRWRRRKEDLPTLCGLQGELLEAAAAAVAPGGLLVYSTCSLEPEENQAAVEAFLKSPAGLAFSVEKPPEGAVPTECLTPEGYLAMLPHVHGTDGAFAARLRRRAE